MKKVKLNALKTSQIIEKFKAPRGDTLEKFVLEGMQNIESEEDSRIILSNLANKNNDKKSTANK